jgi:hypothetical protein
LCCTGKTGTRCPNGTTWEWHSLPHGIGPRVSRGRIGRNAVMDGLVITSNKKDRGVTDVTI